MWKLTIFIVTSFHLLSLAISVEFIAEEDPSADMAVLAMIVKPHHFNLVSSLELMARLWTSDSMLFDIPAAEDAQPKQMTPPRDLRINDLSDPEAH